MLLKWGSNQRAWLGHVAVMGADVEQAKLYLEVLLVPV